MCSLNIVIIIIIINTGNNQRLGCAFDDLDPRPFVLCQVGDNVIRPCKIYGGYQICVSRSIHSINVVPCNLDSILY